MEWFGGDQAHPPTWKKRAQARRIGRTAAWKGAGMRSLAFLCKVQAKGGEEHGFAVLKKNRQGVLEVFRQTKKQRPIATAGHPGPTSFRLGPVHESTTQFAVRVKPYFSVNRFPPPPFRPTPPRAWTRCPRSGRFYGYGPPATLSVFRDEVAFPPRRGKGGPKPGDFVFITREGTPDRPPWPRCSMPDQIPPVQNPHRKPGKISGPAPVSGRPPPLPAGAPIFC